MRPALYLLS
ncbi:hypothetical protein ACHAXR_011903 [Thalassiosira sp. AJA248-18]